MKKEFLVPLAIIFAGAVIAVSIYATRHHAMTVQDQNLAALQPVSLSDHILGNPGAPVVLVEYADIDSEYSKSFQQVMEQVMQNYASTSDVAWVYREFPLINNDQYSEQNAEAAECVASLGDTNDFFTFVDDLEAAAPGDAQFDPSGYDAIVSSMGLSSGSFDACMSAHTFESRVASSYQNAITIGASGSPYSVLLVKGQKPVPISGAIPYSAMKQIIDLSIQKVLAQN